MLGPASIEFGTLFVGEVERAITLRIRETFPERNRDFRPVVGRQLQEIGERVDGHTADRRTASSAAATCPVAAFKRYEPLVV
jgi:ferredoxin